MSQVENLNCYKNWKKDGMSRSDFLPFWSDHDMSNFEWAETFMTNEVPKDDLWDISATDKKLALEDFYKRKNISGECTKHYMCFAPELNKNFEHILDYFKNYRCSYNFLKITPGHNVIGHYDSYSTFIKKHNIKDKDVPNISRTVVLMNDWEFGQTLQVGNSVAHSWNKGAAYTWSGDVWHGACNFGFNDFIVMQVTWL